MSIINKFKQIVDLTPYIKDGWAISKNPIAPMWKDGINSDDFTCTRGANGQSTCYQDCNYTNFYDTTWGATPNERKFDNTQQDRDANWNTINSNNINPFATNKYGAFGKCFDSNDIKCGTDDWFKKTAVNLTPNSIALNKANSSQPFSKEFTSWQNSYSIGRDKASIKGWGTIGQSQSSLDFSSDCGQNRSKNHVRPYNKPFRPAQICNINQTAILNNQGIIKGNTIISNTAQCNISSSGNDFLGTLNKDQFNNYVNLIGSKNCKSNDINGTQTLDCDANSVEICIDFDKESGEGTLDNCIECGKEIFDLNGKKMYDARPRPLICCLDPSENTQNRNENIDLLNMTGNNISGRHISYVCASELDKCPIGSTNVEELEKKCIGTDGKLLLCKDRIDENSCNECKYCTWDRVNNICNPHCPTAPSTIAGWVLPSGSATGDGTSGTGGNESTDSATGEGILSPDGAIISENSSKILRFFLNNDGTLNTVAKIFIICGILLFCIILAIIIIVIRNR